MHTRISERGQVTIPKAVRDRLGLEPGTELDFEADGGRLIGHKRSRRAPVDAVYGVLQGVEGTDEILLGLRGEPDAV